MIIMREGIGENYLVFAADRQIRLAKQPIGVWQMIQREPRLFAARLHIGGTHHQLTDTSKWGIMQKVAKAIPDAMLMENRCLKKVDRRQI